MEESGASCEDNAIFSDLLGMQIIITEAIKMICDKERCNQVQWVLREGGSSSVWEEQGKLNGGHQRMSLDSW